MRHSSGVRSEQARVSPPNASRFNHFDPPRRTRRNASPKTVRPTASAGTKVTTRLPSGVDHDTTQAVMKAALDPRRMATTGNLDGERSPSSSLFTSLPSNVFRWPLLADLGCSAQHRTSPSCKSHERSRAARTDPEPTFDLIYASGKLLGVLCWFWRPAYFHANQKAVPEAAPSNPTASTPLP